MTAQPTIDGILEHLADRLAARVVELVSDRMRGEAEQPAPSALTKSDLAQQLNVSTATIDRFVRRGMPHFYVGDRRRFDIAACRAWLATHGKAAAEPGGTVRSKPSSLHGVRRLTRKGA